MRIPSLFPLRGLLLWAATAICIAPTAVSMASEARSEDSKVKVTPSAAAFAAVSDMPPPIRSAPTRSTPIQVVDDAGRTVTLKVPARRIVSLAPNTTELLFAAGAGAAVVGASRYSDYPEAAKRIPQIGDATMVDLERVLALKPDLLVVWRSGTSAATTAKLSALGVPIYFSEPTRLRDIPDTLRELGLLAGTLPQAERAARAFTARSERLRKAHAGKPPVRVFFQVWEQPLMTIGGRQIIHDAIVLCGGVNIFAALQAPSPTVGREAVISADPQAIVTTTYDAQGSDGLEGWRKLHGLRAVRQGHVYALKTPTLGRQSPRTLDGVEMLCRALDDARAPQRGKRP